MSKCVYNKKRKGQRECPALDGEICSRCCGRHRLTEIDCPDDCRWLQKAMRDQRDSFFSSGSFEKTNMADWLREDLMSGPGASVPGGQAGVDLLFRLLNVVHWKLNQQEEGSDKRVVEDAIRYLEQTHTGQVMSPESAPSSLARALDRFLGSLFDTDGPSGEIQQFKEDLVNCFRSFFDWCDERNLNYVDVLEEFYSEYNLEGWEPVEQRGGELVIRGLSGEEKEESTGPGGGEGMQSEQDSDSNLIVP